MTTTAAGANCTVALTVNGSPARLEVPARMTLADALRGPLGLTGTHLGCEHGVCGMCTVLVDGDAARACLLFAAQLEGADVVTVEGLGTPGDQHPLQAAFAHHHGLQCGFCTPGFLMSAYDLLAHRPEVNPAELPEELSGILCRCTGYRGILAAVADVAACYPDGIPGPRNCRPGAPLGRAGNGVVATPAIPASLFQEPGGAAGRAAPGPHAAGAPADRPAPADLTLPGGEPTIAVDVTSELGAGIDAVWRVIDDIDVLARCLPGAEMTADLGGDHYQGRAKVGVGPVRLSFTGQAHITERDAAGHRLVVVARGTDPGAGQTLAEIRLVAAATPSGTRLRAQARVWLTGRIAHFGRALAGDVSRRMFEEFARAVEQAAATGAAPPAGSGGPSPARLVVGAAAAWLRAEIRRGVSGVRDRAGARRGSGRR